MEVKDIIKEDRNKIVPSYEHRDYYREDGSYLYNSNREANWYKLGILDCFDYFEQNRLKACDNQTPQEAWREAEFVVPFVKEHHRQPTFSDAIEVTRKLIIDKVCEWIKQHLYDEAYLFRDNEGTWVDTDLVVEDLKKAMNE
jgi:hypothetical protein